MYTFLSFYYILVNALGLFKYGKLSCTKGIRYVVKDHIKSDRKPTDNILLANLFDYKKNKKS